MEDGSALKTNDLEVKWSTHEKGWQKQGAGMNVKAKTLSVLINGRFKVGYPDEGKDVILAKEGDFVYCDAGIYHTAEALENSTVLTVRWPSIEGDQKTR